MAPNDRVRLKDNHSRIFQILWIAGEWCRVYWTDEEGDYLTALCYVGNLEAA